MRFAMRLAQRLELVTDFALESVCRRLQVPVFVRTTTSPK
jgi:hypothetical protein